MLAAHSSTLAICVRCAIPATKGRVLALRSANEIYGSLVKEVSRSVLGRRLALMSWNYAGPGTWSEPRPHTGSAQISPAEGSVPGEICARACYHLNVCEPWYTAAAKPQCPLLWQSLCTPETLLSGRPCSGGCFATLGCAQAMVCPETAPSRSRALGRKEGACLAATP